MRGLLLFIQKRTPGTGLVEEVVLGMGRLGGLKVEVAERGLFEDAFGDVLGVLSGKELAIEEILEVGGDFLDFGFEVVRRGDRLLLEENFERRGKGLKGLFDGALERGGLLEQDMKPLESLEFEVVLEVGGEELLDFEASIFEVFIEGDEEVGEEGFEGELFGQLKVFKVDLVLVVDPQTYMFELFHALEKSFAVKLHYYLDAPNL